MVAKSRSTRPGLLDFVAFRSSWDVSKTIAVISISLPNQQRTASNRISAHRAASRALGTCAPLGALHQTRRGYGEDGQASDRREADSVGNAHVIRCALCTPPSIRPWYGARRAWSLDLGIS